MAETQRNPVEKRSYRSFLLRLWCESGEKNWRFQLQDSATGELFGFSSLNLMFSFLSNQTSHLAPSEGQCPTESKF